MMNYSDKQYYLTSFLLIMVIFLVCSNCSNEYFYSSATPSGGIAIFQEGGYGDHNPHMGYNYLFPLKKEMRFKTFDI